MKKEDLKRIKDEYQRMSNLLERERKLRLDLKTKKDTYDNLRKLADELEEVEDELHYVHNDEGIYEYLLTCGLFEEKEWTDDDRPPYLFFGIIGVDGIKIDEYWTNVYLDSISRKINHSKYSEHFALYFNLVSSNNDYKLIPFSKIKEFEDNNYVIDIADFINVPADIMGELNGTVNYLTYEKSMQGIIDKCTIECFKYLIHSETEEEAINKLVLSRKNK